MVADLERRYSFAQPFVDLPALHGLLRELEVLGTAAMQQGFFSTPPGGQDRADGARLFWEMVDALRGVAHNSPPFGPYITTLLFNNGSTTREGYAAIVGGVAREQAAKAKASRVLAPPLGAWGGAQPHPGWGDDTRAAAPGPAAWPAPPLVAAGGQPVQPPGFWSLPPQQWGWAPPVLQPARPWGLGAAPPADPPTPSVAGSVANGRGGGGARGGGAMGFTGQCHACREFGHKAGDCPVAKANKAAARGAAARAAMPLPGPYHGQQHPPAPPGGGAGAVGAHSAAPAAGAAGAAGLGGQ